MIRKFITKRAPLCLTAFTVATSFGIGSSLAENKVKPNATPTPEKVLHQVTVEKLNLNLERTPVFEFSNASNKKFDNSKRWLEIEAELDIQTISKQAILPTLEATFTLVYKQKHDYYQKIERTLSFKNISIEENKVLIVAYLDPDTLRHITAEKRPSLKDITGIAVSVTADQASVAKPEILYKSVLIDKKLKPNKKILWWKSTKIKNSKEQLLSLGETPFLQARPNRYPRVSKPQAVVRK